MLVVAAFTTSNFVLQRGLTRSAWDAQSNTINDGSGSGIDVHFRIKLSVGTTKVGVSTTGALTFQNTQNHNYYCNLKFDTSKNKQNKLHKSKQVQSRLQLGLGHLPKS